MGNATFKNEDSRDKAIREMVDLRCRGFSFAEVAEHCGMSVWTVYKHYTEAAEYDYYGYDPVGYGSVKSLLKSSLPFSVVALRTGLSSEGLKNYMLDRGIRERILPKPSEMQEEGYSADGVLGKFLEDHYLTQKFLDYYGITYYSAQMWAKAAGIEVRKIPQEERSRKNLEEKPKNMMFYGKKMEAKELVDLRLQGLSFAEIGQLYGVNKATVYKEYIRMQLNGYDGYEPFDRKKLASVLRDEDCGLDEIALSYRIPIKGLQNYIADRNIPGREYPTFEELSQGTGEMRFTVAREFFSGKRTFSSLMKFFGGSYKGCRLWTEKIRMMNGESENGDVI